MPTENEVKFVLRPECEREVRERVGQKLFISQGYLVSSRGVSLRIRSVADVRKPKVKSKYYMTFKYTTNGRVVEIEKRIDRRDFVDLWNVSMNRLHKHRYVLRDADRKWEIDFFKGPDHQTYFALAEHEMPEGQVEPESVLPIVGDNLLYKVPLTDSRFSSKLLADVRYARDIYQLLFEEKKNEAAKNVV